MKKSKKNGVLVKSKQNLEKLIHDSGINIVNNNLEDLLNNLTILHPKSYTLEDTLILCLDCSSSMQEVLDSKSSKIDIACDAMRHQIVPNLDNIPFSLIIFPFNTESGIDFRRKQKAGFLFQNMNSRTEINKIPNPKASGNTPLLSALRLSVQFIGSKKGRIILITDGMPNDAPINEILNFVGMLDSIIIDCVGIGSAKTLDYNPLFLQTLAEITGGIFVEAHNYEILTKTLKMLSPVERLKLSDGKCIAL